MLIDTETEEGTIKNSSFMLKAYYFFPRLLFHTNYPFFISKIH